VCCATVIIASAQTQTEYDTIKQSLVSIQQTAAGSLAMFDSASRPANWRTLLATDMQRAILAATTAQNTAAASTVSVSATVSGINVPAGGDLQTALNNANPGDQIVLQAGATYTGSFTLPVKTGTSFITITTSKLSSLPAAGQRVTPANAPAMAKITSPNGTAAIYAGPGAHHYRFVGVEITAPAGIYANTRVVIGSAAETTEAALPHNIEFDRVYIHGDPVFGGKRGIQMNGKAITVQNSWLSDFKSDWQETQALNAWNTPGPLSIVNNRLEAAGISILVGGAAPSIAGVTPSDIAISKNYMTKPVAWRSQKLVVKNLLELKTGRRVTIKGNVIENVWVASQSGHAINLKVEGTAASRAITTDIVVADNIIRHAAGGLTLTGTDSYGGKLTNVKIQNNLFDDIGGAWGGENTYPLFGYYSAPTNVTFENNTGTPSVTPTVMLSVWGAPTSGFVFQGNIFPRVQKGLRSSVGEGLAVLTADLPGGVFTKNVLFGSVVSPMLYPSLNYFPALASQVGWVGTTNYALATTSTYKGVGVNGQDPGVNYSTLLAATATAVSGR
jgi:hypothetical protein